MLSPRRGSRAALAAGFLGFFVSAVAAAITFPVTKTADTADGVCDADCSLREAIIAANAAAGPDTVTIPSAALPYTLTIAGPDGEDASANGDLDITSDLTISGAGAATTIVDGNGTNRVFEIFAGAASFSGLTIRNGLAAGFGGGINYRPGATLTITNSIISNNRASGFGGGINNNSGGTVIVTNTVVSANTAFSFGGGINNNSSGTATVIGSTISNNTAPDGGGINNNSSGSLTLTDSTVSGNTSTGSSIGGGGVLNNSGGPLTIVGSTLSGNTSAGPGGGISNNSSGALTITNSTISANTAADVEDGGGGIYRASAGAVSLTNVTVIGNSAPIGGGLRNNRGDSPITLLRSIVSNSLSGGNCSGVISSLGNNLSSDGTCNLVAAGDLPNTNPQVAPLASNGGPTQTHALLTGSPAINAGGAGCPPPATDQRGVARPQGAACEIGSFECQTGECAGIGATPTPTPTGAPPTATPTGAPPTATPTGIPPTLTPTSVPTAPGGPPANVPTLSFPMLALLGLALATTAVFLLKR